MEIRLVILIMFGSHAVFIEPDVDALYYPKLLVGNRGDGYVPEPRTTPISR